MISMFTAMRRIDAGVSGGSRFVDEEQRHSNLVRLHVTRAGGHLALLLAFAEDELEGGHVGHASFSSAVQAS